MSRLLVAVFGLTAVTFGALLWPTKEASDSLDAAQVAERTRTIVYCAAFYRTDGEISAGSAVRVDQGTFLATTHQFAKPFDRFELNGQVVSPQEVLTHRLGNTPEFFKDDLAVIKVSSAENLPSPKLARVTPEQQSYPSGARVWLVGYPALSGARDVRGNELRYLTTISGVIWEKTLQSEQSSIQIRVASAVRLDGLSGGGAFVTSSDGELTLIGIISGQMLFSSPDGDFSVVAVVPVTEEVFRE